MTASRRLAALALAATAVLGGACGSDNKVGDDQLLDFEEQVGERLGQTTTTTAPATTTTAAPGAGGPSGQPGQTQATQPTATTATTRPTTAATQPTATTTTAPKVAEIEAVEILIRPDTEDPKLDPEYGRVFVGGIVRWINRDSVPRSVQATTGQFRSPMIPAGGTFEYKATTAGLFEYGDGTRPYVNGILEVLAD